MFLSEIPAIASAFCLALRSMLIGELKGRMSLLQLARRQMGSTVAMTGAASLVIDGWRTLQRWTVGLLAASSVFGIMFATTTDFATIYTVGPRTGALLYSLKAPFALLLGYVGPGETITWAQGVGVALVLLGVVLAIGLPRRFRRIGALTPSMPAGVVPALASITPVLILPMTWVQERRRPPLGVWAGALLAILGTALTGSDDGVRDRGPAALVAARAPPSQARCNRSRARSKRGPSPEPSKDSRMTDPSKPNLIERRRGSGVRMVYEILRDEILDLALAPGAPIDEVQLAERFGVSRTPVREAIVRLASEGLVTTLPNRSTLVAAIDYLNLDTYFDALVLMYRVTTRLAAEHHRPDDLVVVRARQSAFAAAVEAQDALEMIATNAAFHSALAEAGRNVHFVVFFNRLLDQGRRILRIYYNAYDDRLPRGFVDEHDAIIAAVERRDVAAADDLARIHGEQIAEKVHSLFKIGGRLQIPL